MRDCKYCGRKYERKKQKCRSLRRTFGKCWREDHFSIVCPQQIQPYSKATFWVWGWTLGSVVPRRSQHCHWQQQMDICGPMGIGNERVKCKINTGSTCSILPRSCLISNKKNKKQKGNFSPTSSPNWASVLGTATVCIHNPRNKTRYTEDFVVVKDGFSPLRHTEEKILAEQPTSSRPWAR